MSDKWMRLVSDRPGASVGGEIVRFALTAVGLHLERVTDGSGEPHPRDRAAAMDPLRGVSGEERAALWDGEVDP